MRSKLAHVLVAIVALLLVGMPDAAAAQGTPRVTIARVSDSLWQASYQLQTPVTSLRFHRPAGFHRERVWRVVTPGYHFTRQGEWQRLTLDSAAVPKREIVFEFAEFSEPLPKEYELFQPFSDGAVAIYTGHLHASAIGRAVGDSTRVDAIRVIPREGQHTVAQGRVQRGVLDFVDSLEDGTYVYIGTATPIETSDVIAIVDPGMPSWLKESFDRNVPALFREYTNRLGAVLPVKPIVYFSFDQRGSGRASGGGTLAGLINMVLSGNEWRVETPAAREQAFWLIAHESAHMWNGQLVSNADHGSHSWMHEGSADAMANDMLLRFGIVDSTTFHARREFALNNCLAAVATGSVETALRRGSTQSVYDCGFVMSMWAEALTRRSNAAVDLFGIWRALIASTRSKGSYDADRYFSTLASLGVTDDAVGRMRAFVASTDSASIALAGLREAGISAHVAEGSLPRAYQQRLARSALGHLMQQACSRVSFNWGDTVRTMAIPSCAPFAREHAVFRIQAIRVSDEGAALHDAVRRACAAGEGVTLHGKDNVLLATVPCTRALPERVPYYRLDR